MPPLTMRGRYLMREFWSDSDLFMKLNADQRELYVGLWMLADDDGWMPRDVPAIAAALYRYADRAPRERIVSDGLTKLRELGKVQSFRCCLYLPSVARYPRAGKKSTDHHTEHRTHSNRSDAKHRPTPNPIKPIQTDLNPSPVVVPSLPDVAGGRAPEGAAAPAASAFDQHMAAHGVKPSIVGKAS
jgi:hypothetical protein